jgi:hypothetical protein
MRSTAALLLAIFLACGVSVYAQTATQPERGPDRTSNTQVPGVDVLPYKGLPFSGVGTTVWSRPIDGGGSITTYVKGNIFRDSQGRIYRERHHFAAANVDPKLTLHEFSILDPVSLTRTTCQTAARHCVITRYRPQFSTAISAAGIFDNGKRMLVRTSLGNNEMEGLPVVGTLETTTLAAGTIGNDSTVTQSREFWYSADLKTNISVTRKDPRDGTQAVHLTLLSRDEPDPGVFSVPAGYTVEDTRPPARASN